MKPSTQARRYVYRVMHSILLNELSEPDGWIFGGVEMDPDVRRLRAAVQKVIVEMKRKGEP